MLNLKNKISQLIKEYEKSGDFSYSEFNESLITEAENILDVKLPNDFVWFLKKYGSGGIEFEVFGIFQSELEFVDETLYNRKYGLPSNLIVIENCDEFVNCLDCDNGKVCNWSCYDKDGLIYTYDSFLYYLIDQLNNYIENMDQNVMK